MLLFQSESLEHVNLLFVRAQQVRGGPSHLLAVCHGLLHCQDCAAASIQQVSQAGCGNAGCNSHVKPCCNLQCKLSAALETSLKWLWIWRLGFKHCR